MSENRVLRQMHALADEIGLDDSERHELTEMLLKVDDTSWAKLDAGQRLRLVDAMIGYHYVSTLIEQRG